MGRGNLFFMTTKNLSRLECYDANYFDSDDVVSLGAEYFQPVDTADSALALQTLFEQLKSHGFNVVPSDSEAAIEAFSHMEDRGDYPESEFKELCSFVLATGSKSECDAAKKSYFKTALEKLKENVAAVTLEQFAGVEQYSIYGEITSLAEDDSADVVYADDTGFQSVDAFIRSLQPDSVYFFGSNILWMK